MTADAVGVLIVEHDENVRELLAFLLERAECTVHSAADGLEAEKLIGSLAPPRLVLLNASLPYQDGYQLLDRIRGQAGWEQVTVLMMTERSQEQEMVRALESGADDYVLMPFQPDVLLARLRRFLRH